MMQPPLPKQALLSTLCVFLALLFTACGGSSLPVSTLAISISSNSVNFGNQVLGTTSQSQSVTLTNVGTETLNISSVMLGGANPGDFTLINTCGNSLAPGAKCTAGATFTPAGLGTRTANVNITDNAPGSPQSVMLTGTGTNPLPSITGFSPTSVLVGSAAQTLTIIGTGFVSTSTVTYNGTGHAASFVDSMHLTIQLSTGDQAVGGNFPVVVTNPGPGGGPSTPVNFAVDQAPAITSGNSSMFTYGTMQSFTVMATGFPAPTLSETGALPSGVTFNPATGALGGTSKASGVFPITITAHNGVAPDFMQNFTLTVGKATLTVTANNAMSIYGQMPTGFTASYSGFVNGDTAATALSGSPSLTTVATAASGVGNYAIVAAVGTLTAANYTFSFVNGTLTVGKATLTVTANNAMSIYGQMPTGFTASYSGFVNGDTAATALSGSPSLTTAATASSSAGNYAIVAAAGTLTATNYTFSFVNGTLTVGKATLTVTANNAMSIYGQTPTGFTASITGFVNGDPMTVVSGTPSLTTVATAASRVGNYAIVAAVGTLTATNYTFSFVNGTLTVGKATLTVTANNAMSIYGQTPTGFTASITGFVNGDPMTVVSGSPSLTTVATAASGVGNYAIVAAAGTLTAANYTFSFVNGTLTVGKATLTVTANNAMSIYGQTPPGFTASVTGFVNGDPMTVVSGTPSLTTVATAASGVGNYAIVAAAGTLTATNYTFSFVNGTLTVGKATLTVTANNAMSIYGQTPPGFTASITGLVNGDPMTVVSGTPSLTTVATAASGVGNYAIVAAAGTLTATNYTFSFVNGTLTVGKATLTVTANNAMSIYGQTPTGFTASYSGFVNGDTAATALFGSPSLTTTATASSPAGNYAIVAAAGTLTAANYTFTFVNGTLTVNKATLTVTANNAMSIYGQTPTGFTASYSGFVNGDTAATALSGSPSLTTTATASSAAGNYAIVAAVGTLTAANYAFSFVNGTLTIDNPMPSITGFSPMSAVAGTAAQTLTINGTNFITGATVSYNGVGHPATFVNGMQLTIQLSMADQMNAGSFPVVVTNPPPSLGPSTPVDFSVTGGTPVVSLSTNSLSFGFWTMGTTSPAQMVTVTNTGNGALTITSVAAMGTNMGDIGELDTCVGIPVTAGNNCTISVTFSPKGTGSRMASLSITDNASDSPQSVSLSGTGLNSSMQFMVLDPTKTFLMNTVTGKPVFMTGDAPQTLMVQVNNADVVQYLTDRQSRGFNVLWVLATDLTDQTGAPLNFFMQTPFNGPDFTNENEMYWQNVDFVVQQAQAFGITLVIDPAFVGLDMTGGYVQSYLNSTDAVMMAFGQFLGNRYKGYSNIIWILGGDANTPASATLKSKLSVLGTAIAAADPNHLITHEACPVGVCGTGSNSSLDIFGGSTWLTLNADYSQYFQAQSQCAAQYALLTTYPTVPPFQIEDWYEGEHLPTMTELALREEGYWEVLSGCYLGRIFGNNAIWTMGGPKDVIAMTWQSQLGSMGSVSQAWLGSLFRSREHWKMVPDANNTVLTAGYGSGTTISVASRTSDGQTIIAYIPNGNATAVTIDLTKITSTTNMVHGWWFNPQDGTTMDMGTVPNTGPMLFTPPDSNDWVLVLDDAFAALPAPGSKDL